MTGSDVKLKMKRKEVRCVGRKGKNGVLREKDGTRKERKENCKCNVRKGTGSEKPKDRVRKGKRYERNTGKVSLSSVMWQQMCSVGTGS